MYVFLKFSDVVRVISNVTIDEDCGPVVDGKVILDSPRDDDSAGASRSTVDAISWFKSLPMEAVYIDCGARDARWCPRSVTIQEGDPGRVTNSITPQVSVRLRRHPNKSIQVTLPPEEEEPRPFMPESARPLFSEHPGVVDFNPIIDEMFERAELLFCRWEELSETGEINREVAKILHCYVFPAVTFQRSDVPVLRECLRVISMKQEAVEKEIMDSEKNVDITGKYLNKQKEVILAVEGMTTQAYLQACNAEFVENFYLHVAKDLQKKNMKLDNLQLKVNDLKKTGQDPERLEKIVQGRDALHETVQRLINVREAIRNHLFRPFIPKKKKKKKKKKDEVKMDKKDASLHAGFQQVHQQLQEHKEQLKRLCYRKLYTSSVREAIESTIKMIQQESAPELGDFSEFSVYMGKSEGQPRKDWKSMQACVEEWLSDGSSPLFHAHMQGCQVIRDLANSVLSDWTMASMGLDPSSVELVEVEAEGGKGKGKGEGVDDEAVVLQLKVRYSATSPAGGGEGSGQNVCERRAPMVIAMKDRVLDHTWKMAEKIVTAMKYPDTPGRRHVNRAWVCYGPYFWREAGQAVESVYTHFHAPQALRVQRMVASLPLDDIMGTSFCQEFLVQGAPSRVSEVSAKSLEGDGVEVLRLRSVDGMSVVSLDMLRCSISDLYSRANLDGAKLKCQMVEMESLRSSSSTDASNPSTDSFNDQVFNPTADTAGKSQGSRSDNSNNTGKDGFNDQVFNPSLATAEESQGSKVVIPVVDTDNCTDGLKGAAKDLPFTSLDTVAKSQSSNKARDANSPVDDGRHSSAESDSGTSVHSNDLFGLDNDETETENAETTPAVSVFDAIVRPYHAKVEAVMEAGDVMEKMRAVWQSVDFLCKRLGEVCRARGMDSLLPMSIFATASFPEDLFMRYYVQLLILSDLKPDFAFHCMYDFSLTNAISTYMYLFEAKFPGRAVPASDESDS